MTARCAVCDGRFTAEQWEDRHTPGLDDVHAGCCPDCNEEKTNVTDRATTVQLGLEWVVVQANEVISRHGTDWRAAAEQADRVNALIAQGDGHPAWPDELAADLALLAEPGRLVTGRFKGFDRSRCGVPVRTTVGSPRFWRKDTNGELVNVSEVAPYGVFKNPKLVDTEAQQMAYRARLEDHLVPLVTKLAELVRSHPDERLCLLCFEDVHAGEECHRRWFADWFAARFGIEVPEVPAA